MKEEGKGMKYLFSSEEGCIIIYIIGSQRGMDDKFNALGIETLLLCVSLEQSEHGLKTPCGVHFKDLDMERGDSRRGLWVGVTHLLCPSVSLSMEMGIFTKSHPYGRSPTVNKAASGPVGLWLEADSRQVNWWLQQD